VSLVNWPDDKRRAVGRLTMLGVSALGANCQTGMAPALQLARELRAWTDLPLIVKPAAGLPGEPLEAPESFATSAPARRAPKPVLAGGCCGTTEAQVAALHAAWYDAHKTAGRSEPGSPGNEVEPS